MWMMHLHVNQKSDYDMIYDESVFKTNFGILWEWPLKTGFTVCARAPISLD